MKHTQLFRNAGAVPWMIVLLASAALPAAAQAAEEAEADAQKTPVAAQEASPQETAKPVEAAAPKAPRIKAQSAQSADDYEASEEISEDLSVSYPVDI